MAEYNILKHQNEPKMKRIIACEDIDFLWEESELNRLCAMFNNGVCFNRLVKQFERDGDDIFLALFDLARKGKIKRKINLHSFFYP